MPRLPPPLLWRAYHLDPLLPRLLRECRDLDSARNELRWIREHAESLTAADGKGLAGRERDWRAQALLRKMVNERSRGKPLQYILGDQPFGNLEILCRKGVLIPRPETEAYTTRAARWILTFLRTETRIAERGERPLRILDLCTGTGCIPLLLHSLLAPSFPSLQIVGVDICSRALALARDNLAHNVVSGHLSQRAMHEVRFVQADVLKEEVEGQTTNDEDADTDIPTLSAVLSNVGSDLKWDVLTANPPYVSVEEYNNGTTKRSVRLYEPIRALVPPLVTSTLRPSEEDLDSSTQSAHARQDLFYPRLVDLAHKLKVHFAVMECGGLDQAKRIHALMKLRCSEAKHEPGTGGSVKACVWRCDQYEDIDVPYPRDFGSTSDGLNGDAHGARAVVMMQGESPN
ncbi:hypothetical protein VTO42DRAFT_631 [Malbranchea cinnamomea]